MSTCRVDNTSQRHTFLRTCIVTSRCATFGDGIRIEARKLALLFIRPRRRSKHLQLALINQFTPPQNSGSRVSGAPGHLQHPRAGGGGRCRIGAPRITADSVLHILLAGLCGTRRLVVRFDPLSKLDNTHPDNDKRYIQSSGPRNQKPTNTKLHLGVPCVLGGVCVVFLH